MNFENIRGFSKANRVEFSRQVNLFVGQNNAGKSTLLKIISLLQYDHAISRKDISLSKVNASVEMHLEDIAEYFETNGLTNPIHADIGQVIKKLNESSIESNFTSSKARAGFSPFPDKEPVNLLYPYLSKRKVGKYDESINLGATNAVTGDFKFLTAKIARLCGVTHPNSNEYLTACEEIIGFPLSTTASVNGHKISYKIDSFQDILLEDMGEGVPNLLGLIVDLCIAKNKIFLFEEIENDIHPKALKSLLNLIERKSKSNQFFISTHSNIVTKYLGSIENSKVFRISMSFLNKLPVSSIEEVQNEPNERLKLLEELGYEPFDFGHWKAWLILEESSAEVIIRDFLIPIFVKVLTNKLRTYSARSLNEVEPKFKDFNKLFVFVHLEEIYKNKAWVIIDAGENETEIIGKMKKTYSKSGWNEDNFLQFSEHDFESYYPKRFQAEVDEILALENKRKKMQRKQELIENVKKWIKENPDDAKEEFKESAKEIIDILKSINNKIK